MKQLIIGILSLCLITTTAIADVNDTTSPGCHKIIKKKVIRKHPVRRNNTHPANNSSGEVCISCIGSVGAHQ